MNARSWIPIALSLCLILLSLGTTAVQAQAELELVPDALDFGAIDVGGSATLPFRVVNDGTEILHVTTETVPHWAFTILQPALPWNVAPGSDQECSVSFHPTEVAVYDTVVTFNSLAAPPTGQLRVSGEGQQAAVSGSGATVPAGLALLGLSPNPFNGVAAINFSVGAERDVRLTIYDILGREVYAVLLSDLGPGIHTHIWSPSHAATGLYLLRLQSGVDSRMAKICYIR